MADKKFAVIGGDRRFKMLCALLAGDGYSVFAAGLGDISAAGVVPVGHLEAAGLADCVILPLPATADGSTLWAPLAAQPIILDASFGDAMRNKQVFAGCADKIKDIYPDASFSDYFASEALQVKNAQATAEGALAVAISNMPETINGAKCLVCGWGRIGRQLALMLRNLGGEVTVAARSETDRAWARSFSMDAIDYDELPKRVGEFSLLINTVPSMIFSRKILCHAGKSATLIDLASQPGGVDFEAAKALGIQAIHALSLPGKYAPLTAARIIKDTVIEMII